MQKFGFTCKLIILILIMFGTAGCWNSRELNQLAIVMGFGIDKNENSQKVQLTSQVIRIGQVRSPQQGSGNSNEYAFWNIKTISDTIFDAVRKSTLTSNRRLFAAHGQILIFNQDIAREGIEKYIDFFLRDHEIYRNLWILVSKDKASEVLGINPELEQIPARYISQLVEARTAASQISGVTLQDFYARLISKTTAPIASLIEIEGKAAEKSIQLLGTAVFKKDKLAGELDINETRGLLWVLGKIKSGIIIIDSPGDKGKISIEIIRASSKIVPEIKDNQLYITIKVNEMGNIGENMSLCDISSEAMKESIEKRKASVIRGEIMAALKKAKEWNTDIFAFGEAVHKKYPQQWKELEGIWDETFPNIEVTIEVDAKIKATGIILN